MNEKKSYCETPTGQGIQHRQNAGRGGSSLGRAKTHGTHSTSRTGPFQQEEKGERKDERIFFFHFFFHLFIPCPCLTWTGVLCEWGKEEKTETKG